MIAPKLNYRDFFYNWEIVTKIYFCSLLRTQCTRNRVISSTL